MKASKVAELLKDPKKVLLLSMTSVQRIYLEDKENIKTDVDNEVVEYDQRGLHYVVDMNDINMIIMNPEEKPISGLDLP